MYRVKTTLQAQRRLTELCGVLGRVKKQLLGILETALEIRRLQGGGFPLSGAMTVRLDGYEIAYELDLDAHDVMVICVEPLALPRESTVGALRAAD